MRSSEETSPLQIPQNEIEKITLADVALFSVPADGEIDAAGQGDGQKSGQLTWNSDTLAATDPVNQANAGALAGKLAGLRIGSVLGTDAKPGYGLENPELIIGLQQKNGQAIEYRLGKRAEDSDYVLAVSNRPEYFRLPGYAGDALIKAAGREQLVETLSGRASDGATPPDLDDTLPAAGAVEPTRGTDIQVVP